MPKAESNLFDEVYQITYDLDTRHTVVRKHKHYTTTKGLLWIDVPKIRNNGLKMSRLGQFALKNSVCEMFTTGTYIEMDKLHFLACCLRIEGIVRVAATEAAQDAFALAESIEKVMG